MGGRSTDASQWDGLAEDFFQHPLGRLATGQTGSTGWSRPRTGGCCRV